MNTLKSGFRDGKIVRRLDEFPELVEALRDGDVLTGRLRCAQIFEFDAGESSAVREKASVGLLPEPHNEIRSRVSTATG